MIEEMMRQTAPTEMVLGSLHYVHNLESFEQVRRNQTRERGGAAGTIENLSSLIPDMRAIPMTAG